MTTLSTFQFRFARDRRFPFFQRLDWRLAPVSLRDVLTRGVHPWQTREGNTERHISLVPAMLQRLNGEDSKVPELAPFGYCTDLTNPMKQYHRPATLFESLLDRIQQEIYFVDALPYLDLLNQAKEQLAKRWDDALARQLAEKTFGNFHDLRRFLKEKDKRVKLSGYDDLDRYDWGAILSLDDFDGREGVLIPAAFPRINLRRTRFLAGITDGEGRLRLTPSIDCLSLRMGRDGDGGCLTWHVERDGGAWRFRPHLAGAPGLDAKAQAFAKRWRTDSGRLCFSTTLDAVEEMHAADVGVLSFPSLNYSYNQSAPAATAPLSASRIAAYRIGRFPNSDTVAEILRDILRDHDAPVSGTKATLVKRLAKLAAEVYTERRPRLDGFFRKRRFVRIGAVPTGAELFPLLEDTPDLRHLVLTMYAMKHLRGHAILDPAHENTTYSLDQLAHALLTRRVTLTGAFLEAV